MPFLFRSCNNKMDRSQLECQGSLLMKVTLLVPVPPFPFRKVTLEAAGETGKSLVSLTPEPHGLVQPQEVTGVLETE